MHRGHMSVAAQRLNHRRNKYSTQNLSGCLDQPPPANINFPGFQSTRHLHQSSRGRAAYSRRENDTSVGAEPGVDPRSGTSDAEFNHFKQNCTIDVIDYDSEEATFVRMGNEQFIQFLSQQSASESQKPPERLAVRWVNIGGIDWSVLRALALHHDLHSLALEDILHESGHNHSKADYYPEHLFIRVLCHILAEPDWGDSDDESEQYEPSEPSPFDTPNADAAERGERSSKLADDDIARGTLSKSPTLASLPDINASPTTEGLLTSDSIIKEEDTAPPTPVKVSKRRAFFSSAKNALKKRLSSLSGFHSPATRELIVRIRELKKDNRVDVLHQPLFIFLLRNGTVISIHPAPDLNYSVPIVERLYQADSVLRTSNDASLLVESLLDLVVDRILEVMDEYQAKIHHLEHKILMNPSMNIVRDLHILSGDLIMHRRTLEPIKTMIFGLRKYDLDRCIALADNMVLAKQQQEEFEVKKKHKRRGGKPAASGNGGRGRVEAAVALDPSLLRNLNKGAGPHVPMRSDDDHLRAMIRDRPSGLNDTRGYLSYKAKVYLADVDDHMEFALTSLDMFAGISENLMNYAFNMASYDMNIVMNRLTIVSIIFLPLTLLTGYFGMNFQPFWSVDKNSDVFFWKIAAPMMVCLIPIFMFDEFKRMWTHIKRRYQDRQAVKHLLKHLEDSNSEIYCDFQHA